MNSYFDFVMRTLGHARTLAAIKLMQWKFVELIVGWCFVAPFSYITPQVIHSGFRYFLFFQMITAFSRHHVGCACMIFFFVCLQFLSMRICSPVCSTPVHLFHFFIWFYLCGCVHSFLALSSLLIGIAMTMVHFSFSIMVCLSLPLPKSLGVFSMRKSSKASSKTHAAQNWNNFMQ